MRSSRVFHAVDSHTEGMPTRVITGGVGLIPGATMNDRRLHFIAHLDHIRRLLMNEPRGHSSMSGAILQPPSRPDCDYGVVYIEASGCLPMCGHGTMGVATVLVETGMVEVTEPRTIIRLDTPAGLVVADVEVRDGPGGFGHPGERRELHRAPRHQHRCRGARGGAVLDRVRRELLRDGRPRRRRPAVRPLPRPRHPHRRPVDHGRHQHHRAAETPDRSRASTTCTMWSSSRRVPTPACRGTRWRSTRAGSTVRPAAPGLARGWPSCTPAVQLPLHRDFINESFIGSRFIGRLIGATTVGEFDAVLPTITGRAWVTGTAQYLLDPDDPFPAGFEF